MRTIAIALLFAACAPQGHVTAVPKESIEWKAAPGLTAQTAADILYALASPHTHQLLRRHCRWTTQRYRTWLTRAVTQELLADTQGSDPPGSQRRPKTKRAGPRPLP